MICAYPTFVRHGILGGGALYSAAARRADAGRWQPFGKPAAAMSDRRRAMRREIDATGVTAMEGNGLELWLLHEGTKASSRCRMLTSSTADEVTAPGTGLVAAYEGARGFPIARKTRHVRSAKCCPAQPAIRPSNRTRWTCYPTGFIRPRAHSRSRLSRRDTAFSAKRGGIRPQLWNPPDLRIWLREQSAAHGCHLAAKLRRRDRLCPMA